MKKNKQALTLKHIFILYLKGFLVFLLILLMFGYFYLLDYQNNLTADAGNRVITAMETLDFETLDELSSNLPISMTNDEIFTQYLESFGGEPDLFFYAGTSKIKNQEVFIIGNRNKAIATLTLEKTGKKSFFGFEKFNILDLKFIPLHEYKIIAPNNVDLLVNGISIDQQVQELQTTPIPAFTQEAFGDIQTSKYIFKGFHYIAEVSVEGESSAEVVYDPTTFTYTIVQRPTQSIQAEIETFGIEAMKAHTRLLSIPYLSRGTLIKDYAYPESRFVSTVNSYDLTVRYPFISDEFKNIKAENFVQYGPAAYSVDVSLTYTLTSTWVGVVKTRVAYPSYKVYMTNLNGRWQVTDMALLSTN